MKSKLTVLIACLCATVFLVGCKGGGGSSSSAVPYGGGSDDPGGGSDDPGGGGEDHTPEPATLGLLGSGLFGYALLRRKKKKK